MVHFWNMKRNKLYEKVCDAYNIVAASEYCVIVTEGFKSDQEGSHDNVSRRSKLVPSWNLILCDEMGITLNTKTLSFYPDNIAMTNTHIIVTDHRNVYVWHYLPIDHEKSNDSDENHIETSIFSAVYEETNEIEKMFDIYDELPCPTKPVHGYEIQNADEGKRIRSVCASDDLFICSRDGGIIDVFHLPKVSRKSQFKIPYEPAKIQVNSDSTKISIVDVNDVFRIFPLSQNDESYSDERGNTLQPIGTERKDVWDMKWSANDRDACAIMEKMSILVCEGEEQLVYCEPTSTTHFIHSFKDLEVKLISLDKFVPWPGTKIKNPFTTVETKVLQDEKAFLHAHNVEDCFFRFKSKPNPKFWKILAKESLLKFNFDVAEKAFVMAGDYKGLSMTKNICQFDSKLRQQAEVAEYLGRDDEAEGIYLYMDRADLAIQLRQKAKDWNRVIQLAKEFGSNESVLLEALEKIGDVFVNEQKWSQAASVRGR